MVCHLLDRKNKQYVVIMDNYFTLVKTMIATRECRVAAMGTACSRYVKDGVCMCVCVCVCIIATNDLFLFLLDPTGHPQSLVSKHYMMCDTILWTT